MSTKDCPECGATVPVSAPKCKECFHDFTAAPPPKRSGLLGFLALVASMAIIAAGTFWYIYNFQKTSSAIVDEETRSIVITTKAASGIESTRIAFDDVVRVESVMGGENSTFELAVVTSSDSSHKGERYILKGADHTLQGEAEVYAEVLDKPLEEVRNIKTFGD
ncbi:MAG: hypothetical protein QGG40_13825 [Myxococcota bacterium]|nr:hypothetical protein [Myxococcota bacterium]